MRRALAILPLLAGCVPAPAAHTPARPRRIVSLDYCADQYVLKLVPRARIAAVSPDARAEFSYMRRAAAGVPAVRASAEDVLALNPDLVVRSYGGGPGIEAMLARAGVPVVQIGYAGDLAGVRRVLIATADALGEPARGAAMAAAFDARLAALPWRHGTRTALYVTPGGVTTGPGSLVDAVLRTAGYRNFEDRAGWSALPLERLAYARPDVVAAAFFDTRWNRAEAWSATGHPVARAALADRPTAALPGAWTACGGWFVLDAVAALAKTRAAR